MATTTWTAAWALLTLGALHGLNPGMGWLFAVALGTQQGDRRAASFVCTQCARQLGMIGGAQGGSDPFAMLQNLIQQQQGGQGSLFDALSGEAQQDVMRGQAKPEHPILLEIDIGPVRYKKVLDSLIKQEQETAQAAQGGRAA